MTSGSGAGRGREGREEIEIKLPCENFEGVRQRLRDSGASLLTPTHFESNDLYDDRDGHLSQSGSTLRLRRARDEAILTYKGPARFEQGVKRREERETRVSDSTELEAILRALGLLRRFRYEKRREEWQLEDCQVALDETPIGRFVEIEGDPVKIRRAVLRLGLDFASAIPYSYARLYALKRQEHPQLPEDMVFEDVKRQT